MKQVMSQKSIWIKEKNMSKTTNYEISDSLWERATEYASSVWDSWGKDVDAYVEDVMKTDSRSDDELYGSTQYFKTLLTQ